MPTFKGNIQRVLKKYDSDLVKPRVEELNTSISLKADKDKVYTKAESDNKFALKTDLDGLGGVPTTTKKVGYIGVNPTGYKDNSSIFSADKLPIPLEDYTHTLEFYDGSYYYVVYSNLDLKNYIKVDYKTTKLVVTDESVFTETNTKVYYKKGSSSTMAYYEDTISSINSANLKGLYHSTFNIYYVNGNISKELYAFNSTLVRENSFVADFDLALDGSYLVYCSLGDEILNKPYENDLVRPYLKGILHNNVKKEFGKSDVNYQEFIDYSNNLVYTREFINDV